MNAPQPLEPTDRNTEEVNDRLVIRPAVDIYENPDEILLVADMPGIDRDAIRIDVEKGILTIAARRPDQASPSVRLLAGMPAAFDYKRVFQLPDAVDEERIAANLRDGVLEVRLPRHERTRPRRITIGAN